MIIREARIEDAAGIAKVHVDTWRTRRFYEALGGQQIKTERAELGGVTINEVAYGWTDINTILQDRYL